MVEKLLLLNYDEQIIILDNGSTYPPLLDWYKTIQGIVEVRMLANEGHLALWGIGLDKELGDFFVYTDSDLELDQSLPVDWKEQMLDLINKYEINKIALAIRIDDLPDHYRYKNQVKRNEGRWWLEEVEEGVYKADTDTTFALMRNIHDNCFPSLRVARNGFICRHVPFYIDLNNLDPEEKYYLDNHDSRKTTQYTKQHINPEIYGDI
jgi:glycosyltransferase involved in cell wall biosynthesis